jgi:hypothetical protein
MRRRPGRDNARASISATASVSGRKKCFGQSSTEYMYCSYCRQEGAMVYVDVRMGSSGDGPLRIPPSLGSPVQPETFLRWGLA